MGKKKNTEQCCRICKRVIFTNTDTYVILTDFKCGRLFDEGYYHTNCYNNQVLGKNHEQQRMKAISMNLLGKADQAFEQMGIKNDKEFVVDGKPKTTN